jgi:4-amino-4-deoxy-L-arabinose transferase-like glycosyltransferase
MSNHFNNFREYLNNGKNYKKIIILLVIFLSITKLPPLFSSDIQPWDEGMYALRVLSIHENGDFLDQSAHSVGGFYSASHPPLLIWIGWIFISIFGTGAWVFKLIPFIFSILCVIYIVKTGKLSFNTETGVYAALLFSGTIIFNIFCKRFQFDIPYTFLIIASFYFFILYLGEQKRKFLIYAGIFFGACLMIKILVGIFIPLVLAVFLIINRKQSQFNLKDLSIIILTGLLIAFPWHLYMVLKHGSSFTEYFINFHLYKRALEGVEHNEKQAGVFYYIKYLLSILPLGILIFPAFLKDVRNYRQIKKEKLLLWIWAITGFLIISVFKTKLESYILLMLPAACLIISGYAASVNLKYGIKKFLLLLLIMINFAVFFIGGDLLFLKHLVQTYSNTFLFAIAGILILCLTIFYISKYLSLNNIFIALMVIFFLSANIYYMIFIPPWEDNFSIESVKETVKSEGRKKIVYIGSHYRYNPQFSFYFKGIDLGWQEKQYEYILLDTKDGVLNVKEKLESLNKDEYNIIIEADYINRGDYPDPQGFLPDNFKFVMYSPGYLLYHN